MAHIAEQFLEVSSWLKAMEQRDQIRHSFWNSLLVFNSILISAFALILAITPSNKYITEGSLITFFILAFIPILSSLINYWVAYIYATKKTVNETQNIMKLFPDKFVELMEKIPESMDNKFFRRCNKFLKWSERISSLSTVLVVIYFFLTLREMFS